MRSFISIHKLFCTAALEFSEKARWMPSWLKEHDAMKAVKDSKVFKIFSVFGLNDFRQPIEDPSYLENFIDFISSQLSKVVSQSASIDSENANRLEQVAYKLLREIMNPAMWSNGKHRVPVQIASDDKKLRIDAGTSIIKAYNIIRATAAAYGTAILIPDIESTREFKDYSKRGKMTLVFSTNHEDIAAMSSRSDWESCQTLGTMQGLNACVIGSTLSKFVGICYITSGKPFQDRGETMIVRALIRFVVDTKTNKPSIFIDQMYPGYYKQYAAIIKQALQSHTSVPVVNSFELSETNDFGRFSLPVENIKNLQEHQKSYLDTPGFFSNKSKKEDLSAKVDYPTAYFMNFATERGALLSNTVANFLITSAKPNDEEIKKIRLGTISFGRRILKALFQSARERIKNHYYKGNPPLSLGMIKGIIKQELAKSNIKYEIYNFIDNYKPLQRNVGEEAAIEPILNKYNLKQPLAKFLIDNIYAVCTQEI